VTTIGPKYTLMLGTLGYPASSADYGIVRGYLHTTNRYNVMDANR